jgi:hypothetical protein
MRAFAEAWPDEPIVQQAVARLPWGHNVKPVRNFSASEATTYVMDDERISEQVSRGARSSRSIPYPSCPLSLDSRSRMQLLPLRCQRAREIAEI